MVLFGVSVLWAITSVRQSHCKRPLAYQYNKYFLEETDLYLTDELKKLAKDNAMNRGEEQMHDVRSYLGIPETQQPPEGVSSQPAFDQANTEQPSRSSDTHTTSSEHLGKTEEKQPLLQDKK